MKASLLSVALAVFGGVNAVNPAASFILRGDYLTYSRQDPITHSGRVSGHIHGVVGASNFRNVLNSPETMQQADCTTAYVSADKSNYWHPLLYFINANGTYSPMVGYNRIYYKIHNADGGTKVNAFPPGLRMIAGDAHRRDPGSIKVFGVENRFEEGDEVSHFIPNGTMQSSAPEKVITVVTFPNCGLADQTLDSEDHFSHMTWAVHSGVDGPIWSLASNQCPDTHPIMYPQLIFEVTWVLETWQREQWSKTGANFILSNGDTTGLTFHVDFVNGWDQHVLQDAIDNCPRVGDEIHKCSAFKGLLKPIMDGNTHNCRYQGQIPDEEIGFVKPLDRLPGCNERWDWDGPLDKPPCEGGADPGFITPTVQYSGPAFLSIPVALPGIDNASSVEPILGRYQKIQPTFGPWAQTWLSLDPLKPATLDPQSLGAAYDALHPPNRIDLASATKGFIEMHANRTFQCRGPNYLPCPAVGVPTTPTTSVPATESNASPTSNTTLPSVPSASQNASAPKLPASDVPVAPGIPSGVPKPDVLIGSPVNDTTGSAETTATNKSSVVLPTSPATSDPAREESKGHGSDSGYGGSPAADPTDTTHIEPYPVRPPRKCKRRRSHRSI